MQELREMDYVGIVLFTGGLILFLLGLSAGGTIHPWDSAYVIATLVVGGVTLVAFVLYEIYMPLRRPLVPMELFKNYDYDIANILSIVGGMVYYSASGIPPPFRRLLIDADSNESTISVPDSLPVYSGYRSRWTYLDLHRLRGSYPNT